jgi:hypothetical protein
MLSIQPNLSGSGYEIHKAIEDNFGSFWGESYGQIYPTLKRLAAEGLISPSKSTNTSTAAAGVCADRCRARQPPRVACPAFPERSASQ